MKRWTLLLFLLLVPFTMAPRTSVTPPSPDLEVVLVASRTAVRSGDVVNLVGQVRNVGSEVVQDPTVTVNIRGGDKLAATIVQLGSGCEPVGEDAVSEVTCTVRDLRPRQQATFRFALRLDGAGSATISTGDIRTSAPPEDETVTVEVAPPPAGDRA